MLHVKRLSVSFGGRRVVDDVSFSLDRGETLALVGESGSGVAAGNRSPCCYTLVPFDRFTALKADPKAKAQWSDRTPIERRDFIAWMDELREPAAHRRRIEKACALLATGMRGP